MLENKYKTTVRQQTGKKLYFRKTKAWNKSQPYHVVADNKQNAMDREFYKANSVKFGNHLQNSSKTCS